MNLPLKSGWVDRLPSWMWLALPVVALTPVWRWCAARLLDRSDDPLGIVALAALAVLVLRDRKGFIERPRIGWLVLATLLVAAAILGGAELPALARGVLAVLAVCATLMALRIAEQPMLAFVGLALLALPLLSSLQFFVGFPLRVVTAEASRLLLTLFAVDIERSGTALVVAGRLVMVDAPCSGIQMGWVAYFTACAAAAWLRVSDGRFLRRVPFIGVTVLAGNIVRNTVLVVKEAGLVHWPEWTHEAIGLATFTGVCLLVLWYVISAAGTTAVALEWHQPRRLFTAVAWRRGVRVGSFITLAGLTLWPWLQPEPVAAVVPPSAIEWPQEFEGRPLRPLALSAVEQRFADRFPGAIARFTDGERAIVLHHVTAPTRMLHPAADCYRGLGYRVLSSALVQDGDASILWRCFVAEKNDQRLRVCERIVDAQGQGFTDASAWYWAAVTGRSHGPWRAITKATINR
ncbi:MAG: exosortase Q [Gammaproteobacteria bacterium]|nr:exosortase Q [Gammaproteobacteria bacterium]